MVSVSTQSEVFNLSEVIRTLWRGKWLIAFCTIIFMLMAGYYSYFLAVPKYRASSVVMMETREQQVTDIESVMSGLSGDASVVNTEVEVLKSRNLLEKIVTELRLTEDPEFNAKLRPMSLKDKVLSWMKELVGIENKRVSEKTAAEQAQFESDGAVDALLERMTVRNVPQSLVFRVTVETTSAQKSARIANEIVDSYIVNQLETKFEATETATTWLSERVAELKTNLEATEAKAKEFNSTIELVSPEALELRSIQLKDLRERIKVFDDSRNNQQAKLALLDSANTREEQSKAANDRTLARLLDRINSVGSADSQNAKKLFDTRFISLADNLRNELDRNKRQQESLIASAAELEEEIRTQSDDLVQLQQLQREAEASRLIYEYFLGRLKETSVQQGIQQADSRELSRAIISSRPSAPRKTLIMALAMITGAMLGTALVLLREATQNTFRSAEQLEKETGYTVFGNIPRIRGRNRKSIVDYVVKKPTSILSESIRNLRTSVLMSNVDNPPQMIMSTSSIPGEGKTTQSLLLAQNFSGMGKKVLVIEGDIRRRVFSQYFDLKNTKGILSVLSGSVDLEDAVVFEKSLNADILVGEKSDVNAADVFSSKAFEALVSKVRESYDIIIIDTPPVLVVPDSRVIGQFVDAIVFTVRWDFTRRNLVVDGLKSFETVGLRVNGLVLSQIDQKTMKSYGYGYNYGSHRYYDN